MEKKENDVKFIVGIIILLVIFGVVGGSFWNLVAKQAEKDKQRKPALSRKPSARSTVEAGDVLKEMVSWIWTKRRFSSRYSQGRNL